MVLRITEIPLNGAAGSLFHLFKQYQIICANAILFFNCPLHLILRRNLVPVLIKFVFHEGEFYFVWFAEVYFADFEAETFVEIDSKTVSSDVQGKGVLRVSCEQEVNHFLSYALSLAINSYCNSVKIAALDPFLSETIIS